MDRKMTTLIGLVCLLAGVIVGFLLAPVKKGIYCGNNTIEHASTAATGIKYTSPANYKPILAVRIIF